MPTTLGERRAEKSPRYHKAGLRGRYLEDKVAQRHAILARQDGPEVALRGSLEEAVRPVRSCSRAGP